MKNSRTKNKYFFRTAAGELCLAAMLIFVCFSALRFGSAEMGFAEFVNAVFNKVGFETQSIILYSVRLPRIMAGILSGIGLSVSGVLLQSITGNDLAGPNIIGVNAGAGFFVAVFLSFFPALSALLPLAAFAGALTATLTIIAVAGKTSGSSTVILAGIAITALLNAAISFLNLLDTDVLASYNAFSIGGLNGVTADKLIIPCIIIFLSLAVSLFFSQRIDVLCLGDAMASGLGVNTTMLRIICIVCASASAAATVCFAGLLGFVGLVVPHIARKITGGNTKHLLINSALIGAATVVLADLLGRIVAAPSEIPVGIMMAFAGAPFFLALLLRRRHAVI